MKKATFNPTKKILASASMLLVSSLMLSSATYAWFTMNKTVTVDGMQLNVKADSTYLIVGTDSSAATLQGTNAKDITLSNAALTVFPSAHNAITNTSDASANANSVMTNWYYKYADLPTASTATESARTIATTDFETDYVLHKTVYVTLAAGSDDAENLRCTGATFTSADSGKFNDAVTVLVTSSAGVDEASAGGTRMAGNELAATVTDQSTVQIDIWVYYDGNDASVYTNNKANLDDAELTLTFAVDYSAS